MCAVRQKYLCLKGGTHTDFYTAFATEELRATPPAVLCSVSLSITVYTKTRNPAALVFIPISAGRRAGMRIFMILWAFVFYPKISLIQSCPAKLIIASLARWLIVAHRRATIFSCEANASLQKPSTRSFFQIRSAGFISGVQGRMNRIPQANSLVTNARHHVIIF